MRILTRYIVKTTVMTTLLVVLILLGIESFLGFVNQLSDIGKGDYGIGKAFLYVMMQLPFDLYQLFPIAGFIGCLIGLSRLAQTSELTVMRAAGVSILRIIAAVMLAATMLLVVATLIGETVSPRLQYQADQLKHPSSAVRLDNIWLRHKNTFVYIKRVVSLNEIEKITLFELDPNGQMVNIREAASGVYRNHQWELHDITETRFVNLFPEGEVTSSFVSVSEELLQNKGGHRPAVKSVHLMSKAPLGFMFNPRLLQKKMQLNTDQQTLIGLWHNIQFRHQAGLLAYSLEFALWQRLVQPFTTLVMISLGVPFIFGSLRSVTMGRRVLMGIFIGFAFYMINHFLGPIALVYQWPAWIAALLPTILFFMVFCLLLRRVR